MNEVKKKSLDHRSRKNQGSAEFFRKQRRQQNALKGKQVWVPSSFQGTIADFDKLTDEQVLAIVPAHWERIKP